MEGSIHALEKMPDVVLLAAPYPLEQAGDARVLGVHQTNDHHSTTAPPSVVARWLWLVYVRRRLHSGLVGAGDSGAHDSSSLLAPRHSSVRQWLDLEEGPISSLTDTYLLTAPATGEWMA